MATMIYIEQDGNDALRAAALLASKTGQPHSVWSVEHPAFDGRVFAVAPTAATDAARAVFPTGEVQGTWTPGEIPRPEPEPEVKVIGPNPLGGKIPFWLN